MNNLCGKKIVVAVSGSIAAYKSVTLVRNLIKNGSDVRVVMTTAATNFIAPLTFATVSKFPVSVEMYSTADALPHSGSWHIDWAAWADAMIIAPATASTISKLATGQTDNALTVIATAMKSQIFVAPAMDAEMFVYPALKKNLKTLQEFGMEVLPSPKGEHASGVHGEGRMMEPEDIIDYVNKFWGESNGKNKFSNEGYETDMSRFKIVVTAGHTIEPIDAVRYIANHSTGKMGYAIATEAAKCKAAVVLISGSTSLPPPAGVSVVSVSSAKQMFEQTLIASENADVVIAAAAVADYRPKVVSEKKIKRRELGNTITLELEQTEDILKTLGDRKKSNQILVGFALETDDLIINARKKLLEKKCDFIVANPANKAGAGFGEDTNIITIVKKDDEKIFEKMSKAECAKIILNEIVHIHS